MIGNSSDRPPLASDSLLGDGIKRESEEAWQRELERPAPDWVSHPGKKCRCGAKHASLIAVHIRAFAPYLRRMQCQRCGRIWVK